MGAECLKIKPFSAGYTAFTEVFHIETRKQTFKDSDLSMNP
jgi:hypothetical protein